MGKIGMECLAKTLLILDEGKYMYVTNSSWELRGKIYDPKRKFLIVQIANVRRELQKVDKDRIKKIIAI